MKIKLKWILIFQGVIILILASWIASDKIIHSIEGKRIENGFISSKIYKGAMEPKGYSVINFKPLRLDLTEYISSNKLNASVYVENLRNGAYTGINEKIGFFPASLNKLPVAILIMRKVEMGELNLDSMIEIKESDRTDSYGELYKTESKELPLNILLEKLLRDSDNTALRVLLRNINLDDLQFLIDYYGMDITVKELDSDLREDLVSPKSVSTIFISLYFSTVLETENSEYLLELMSQSALNVNQIAEIPDDVRIAHKFGVNYYEKNMFFHDCGIMYVEDGRLFYCVMTKGLEDDRAIEATSEIIHKIYEYFAQTKFQNQNYETKPK